ncbi:hypothetical protein CU002_1970 [Enterococcus faecium]|nr:hypothetical protein [Enterococcus faecium]
MEFSSHPLVAVITKIKLSCKGEIEHGKKIIPVQPNAGQRQM